MSCPDDDVLAAYAERNIDRARTHVIEAHLDGCATCRQIVAELVVALDEGSDAEASSSRYARERLIGSGGMGVVYEATDRELGTRIALKTLRDVTGPMLVGLKQEFRALADVRHPNLVRLFELVREGSAWFFTMELVSGLPFDRYVRPDGQRFDEPRLRASLDGLVEGLCAVHAHGKIHCDIKPSNVLVESNGRVVLLDFGLVRELSTDTEQNGAFGGTLGYASPEQHAGQNVGTAADWYAVGAMLHEALTGELPKSASAIRPPSHTVRDVPPDLDALCVALLQPDPASRPDHRGVRAHLGRASDELVDPAPPKSLFGRTRELRVLHEALASSLTQTRVVIIEGESGIGKSTLLRRFLEDAKRSGAAISRGRCHERESVPFKAFDEIIDALGQTLVTMMHTERAALIPTDIEILARTFVTLAPYAPDHEVTLMIDPLERKRRLHSAMRDLFFRLAQRGRHVLAIDDVQWDDADSRSMLEALVHAPDAPPILVVLVTRIGASIELPCEVKRLTLTGLSDDASHELVANVLGHEGSCALSSDDVTSIVRESHGHPLFLGELLRRARSGVHAPMTLESAIDERIAALEDAPRDLLEIVSLAAGPTHKATLAHAAAQPPPACARALTSLREELLARTEGDGVEPYHDRIAACVKRGFTDTRRAELHARLALALEACEPTNSEGLAIHHRGAGNFAHATRHAREAARGAENALAFERAARLYRLAIETEPSIAEQKSLQSRLGNVLANGGHQADAAEAYLAAIGAGTRTEDDTLRHAAAAQLLHAGRIVQGLSLLDDVLERSGIGRQRSTLATLAVAVWMRIRLLVRGFHFTLTRASEIPPPALARLDALRDACHALIPLDLARAFELHTRHLLQALDAGETTHLVQALMREMLATAAVGQFSGRRARRLLRIADELARSSSAPFVHGLLALATGGIAFYAGRFPDAHAHLDKAIRLLREHGTGVTQEISLASGFDFGAMLFQGTFRTLRPMFLEWVRDTETRRQVLITIRMGFAVSVWLADDDVEEVERQAALAAPELAAHADVLYPHMLDIFGRATVALYRGDETGPLEDVRAKWPEIRRLQILRSQWLRIVFWDLRGRAALALAMRAKGRDRRVLMRDVLRCAVELDREDVPWPKPLAAMLRAGWALLADKRVTAIRCFNDAARGADAAGLLMVAVVARLRKAEQMHHGSARASATACHARMLALGVRNPDRFARIYAPVCSLANERAALEAISDVGIAPRQEQG